MKLEDIAFCKDYDDFCEKSGLHGKPAIEFLLNALSELKKHEETS